VRVRVCVDTHTDTHTHTHTYIDTHTHIVKQLGFVESMLIVFQLIIVARSFALPAL